MVPEESTEVSEEVKKTLPETNPKDSTEESTLPEKEILIGNESDIDALSVFIEYA